MPSAIEPCEIIHSENDGPFESRTLLGWVIHGVPAQEASSSVAVYRVKMAEEMNQQLKDLYNMDFSERVIHNNLLKTSNSLPQLQAALSMKMDITQSVFH